MNLKNLGKDTLIYGGSDILIKFIAFFTFPVIASTLTPANFGVLELIMTLIGLLSLFVNCGVNNAVQRFYWDEGMTARQRMKYISTGFFLQLIFWSILILLLIGFVPYIENKVIVLGYGFGNIAIFSAFTLIIINQFTQYIQDIIRLYFKPVKFFIFSFLGRALTAILAMIVVVFYAGGIDGLLITQALIGVLVLPLGFYFIRFDFRFTFDRVIAQKIISYGYPFIFMGLAYWIFSSMDRWMLASMASLEETGQYSVAFRFSTLVFLVSTAFGQAWSPYAIKLKTDYPETYRQTYVNIFFLLIYTMLFIGGGLALFSGELIGLIMADEYAHSSVPLAILSFAIIMQSTQQITAAGISIEKKTKILAIVSWFAALVNLAGNYFLIPIWGATGAATATLLSYSFITVTYLIFSQKLHYLPIKWSIVFVFIGLGCCILSISILFNTVEINLILILCKILFGLICCVLGYWAFPFKKIVNNEKI